MKYIPIALLACVLMSCKKDRNVVRFEVTSFGSGFDISYVTQTQPQTTLTSTDDFWSLSAEAGSGEYVFLSAVSNADPGVSATLTASIYFENELVFTKDATGYNQPVATVAGELP